MFLFLLRKLILVWQSSRHFDLDLTDTVQVGVMGHAWAAPYDTRAEFDYVRFAENAPTTQSECENSFRDPV